MFLKNSFSLLFLPLCFFYSSLDSFFFKEKVEIFIPKLKEQIKREKINQYNLDDKLLQQFNLFDTFQIKMEDEIYYYKVINKYIGNRKNISLKEENVLLYAPSKEKDLQLIVIATNTGKLVKI